MFLPTTVAELRTTSRLLDRARDILATRIVYVGHPGYCSNGGHALSVPAAIWMAHTGALRPPTTFEQDACDHHPGDRPEFDQHTEVAQAIRFLSTCVAHDTGYLINEENDYLEHLCNWPASTPTNRITYTSSRLTNEQVMDTITDAAEHAAALADQLERTTARTAPAAA
ncbi:hypothetical protein ACFQ6Q_00200 [Streptomyces sp. NPDC056437]|uniref:hypothetical protein n=1 Tax=Streptomyces sp. NPDC056437 TaxID=3345816 RepID=UPI0036B719B5